MLSKQPQRKAPEGKGPPAFFCPTGSMETGMEKETTSEKMRPELASVAANHAERCIQCGKCSRQCLFLERHGSPRDFAEKVLLGQGLDKAFFCSLCGLCGAVCPVKLQPAALFLEMRRQTVEQNRLDLRPYRAILGYERRGTSRLFTYYWLPEGCDTVLFPGCALPGSRPHTTEKLFAELRRHIPSLGIVLDCCTKPSHDLGRQEFFEAMFGEMRDFLVRRGVRRVLTACPNCHSVFRQYGRKLRVESVYEVLVGAGLAAAPRSRKAFTVHDSCVARGEEGMQRALRQLVDERAVRAQEMKHSGKKTLCCGEGGSVPFVAPDLSSAWTERRLEEAGRAGIVVACAGCAGFLGRRGDAVHVLDLVFFPEKVAAKRLKVWRAPFTYLQRLLLKRRLKKLACDRDESRERDFRAKG